MTNEQLLELHNQPGSDNPSIDWVDASIIGSLNAKGKR